MMVVAWNGGVRIELTTEEAVGFANWLDMVCEGWGGIPNSLSVRLNNVLELERE